MCYSLKDLLFLYAGQITFADGYQGGFSVTY
jgi:hypothetical protein